MIYPENFELKIGFTEVRSMLRERCLSSLGKSQVDEMTFSSDAETVNEWHAQTDELRLLLEANPDFPLSNIYDVRESVSRARIANTHLEEDEFFDLRRSLDTIHRIVQILHPDNPEQRVGQALFLLADGIATFPHLVQRIDQVIDKFGHMRDTASPELQRIRRELVRAEGSVSRTLHGILRAAQAEGIVDKDVTPAVRDGRLVIPVAPGLKRRINGIVHDESATGRTVFVEPKEVVEANNHIRELESEERQEVIRILTALTQHVRPNVREILDSFHFLGVMDFLQAKVQLGKNLRAISPQLKATPHIDWIEARHPLLEKQLASRGGKIVPLGITLTPEKHILMISGPNAGGKSVCLKTVGLLQYMLQCGVPVPVSERSTCGIFDDVMIDIGDEQSLENDLSTYSSHLLNMKNMMKQANDCTLILIDEFGTGTEPQIGGAIAESVLDKFCSKGAWGVITTHYQNLKHFADTHPGVANGAMLYDRHEMRALFQLAIGRPGSSFAIEIARKIGLPEDVIAEASEIVGSDYIQSDKYLQDIVRDKRYWEGKRQTIHQREKDMEKTIARYEQEIKELQQQRREIVAKAKAEASELLRESNRRIENAIREIRERQAEKEATKKIREELHQFEQAVKDEQPSGGKKAHGLLSDDDFEKKVEQLRQRKERREKRKQEKAEKALLPQKQTEFTAKLSVDKAEKTLAVGDTVRIRGLKSTGVIESIDGQMCTVIFGDMRSKMRLHRLESVTSSNEEPSRSNETAYQVSRATRDTIDDHKKNFHQDLDVRGMRGDEALNAVQYFIDDAILVGMSRVRILHGKGNGILRNLIRQYLATVPNVEHYADEHVQFGGAGITVVDL
ncbi:methionine ABC transporter substrate-binding protein [Prevotella sp. HMSC069G02]|nr:methionine ABC transporter substrate-binding protein [Prevotella sp. HMSC069G02]